jgi:hypothetical protein
LLAVAQRVHRLPEAMMEKGVDLIFGHKSINRFLLEHLAIVLDVGKNVGLQDKETTVNPATLFVRLLPKRKYLVVFETEQ